MNCILNPNEQENLLLGYCSSTLAPDTARTYERHLATCEHCRSMVDLQKLLDESLEDWQAPPVSEDFDQKLFARIQSEQAAPLPWWREFLTFSFGWKPLLPVALAALALIVFLNRTPEASPVPQPTEVLQAEDLDKVERALDDFEALQALHQQESGAEVKESL